MTPDFDLNEIMKLKIALENCRDAFCRFQGRGGDGRWLTVPPCTGFPIQIL